MSYTTSNSQIGEYKHKITYEEMPEHSHALLDQETDVTNGTYSGNAGSSYYSRVSRANKTKRYWYSFTQAVGKWQPHNNVQPSIVVFFWKRIS